jgi:hypothetical protein
MALIFGTLSLLVRLASFLAVPATLIGGWFLTDWSIWAIILLAIGVGVVAGMVKILLVPLLLGAMMECVEAADTSKDGGTQ